MLCRFKRSVIALVALMAFVGSGCAGPPEGGVGVRTIATELAFGPPPEPDRPAAPAGFAPGLDRGPVRVEGPAAASPEVPLPTPPPPPQCPFAPLTAAPEVAAPVDITARPEVGRYRWVHEGYQETSEFGRVVLGGLIVRSVLEVNDTADGFAFTTEEKDVQVGVNATIRTTYQVFEGSNLTDDGVYITRIVREGPDGREREFNPTPRIMVFPLPAEIGQTPVGDLAPGGIGLQPEQMNTTGIDPTTLETMTHSGTVVGKRQVDACGELLDSFLVSAEQTFVRADGEALRRRYYYGVAPHMGGLIVFESVAVPCEAEVEEPADESPGSPEGIDCFPPPLLAYDAWIGQLEPDGAPREG